ncbi:surp module domain-containing protein [Cyclospora cayetanensis]|uniref:Surp module domain-containing protein n=1 Tax=Cyclospora cayetanensis TaxID=88456 RepID=A0A1D3DA63_9EIME|nr:surp module domain-containing protein [Cyclospora cayetanensis]
MSTAVELPQRPSAPTAVSAAPAGGGAHEGSPGSAHPDLIFPPADMRGVIEKTAQFVAKNGAEFESRVLREQSATKFGFLLPNNPYHAFYKLKVREFATGEAAPTPQREQQNPQFAFLKPSHHLFSYFASLVDAYTKCLLPQKETLEGLKETAGNRQALMTRIRRRMLYERQQLQRRKEKETKTQEERRLMMSLEWTDFHVVETIDFTEEDERLPLAAPIDFKAAPRELPKALLSEVASGVADAPTGTEGEKVDSIAKLIEGAGADDDDEAMETEDEEETAKQQEAQKQQPAAAESAAGHTATPGSAAPESEQQEDLASLHCGLMYLVASCLLQSLKQKFPPNTLPKSGLIILFPWELRDAPCLPVDDAHVTSGLVFTVSDILHSPMVQTAPLRVVKGYVRPKKRQAAAGAASGFQRCPITGQLIAADQMTNHLRILLLDPKWKEQKDRFLEKAQAESAFAPLEDVEGYLAQFVAKRPDLFGSVDDHARLEAEAEVDPLRVEAAATGSQTSVAAPEAKRQRVDNTSAVAAESGASAPLLLTVVCREGDGLEAQEAQVEVDRNLTTAQLKQSLLDAGIGAETLKARDLQLSSSIDGNPLLDHLSLAEAGIRSAEGRLYLSVVSR